MKYKTILADPAWHYNTWDKKISIPTRANFKKWKTAGAVSQHYPTMQTKDICNLPVADYADNDCCLFLWATWPNLEAAFEVGKAWGFRYVTDAFLWTKTSPGRGNSFLTKDSGWHFGLGYWTRANTEPCLLFTKGHPKRINNDVAQLIIAPVGRHSAKPQEQYDRIERLVEGPYLELFARNKERKNWSFWGNEIEPDIDLAI